MGPRRAHRSTRPTRFELLEIHGRAWHPDIVSELTCVHQSIFEHAEIDSAQSKVSDASAPKCPSTCGAWMRLIFRVSSIAGPCSRPLTPEVAGSSPFFVRPFGSEMSTRENGLSGGFSFRPDDDEEFRGGRGKCVNRPPATKCDPHFLGFLRSL